MKQLVEKLPFVKVSPDKVVILFKTVKENMIQLYRVVSLIASHGFKQKILKCEFAKPNVNLLGHIVSKKGVEVDPANISDLQNVPGPTNQTEAGSFLGRARYYRRLIHFFASISAPLHTVTSQKTKFEWCKEREQTVKKLKKSMPEPPVLPLHNFDQPFVARQTRRKRHSAPFLHRERMPRKYTSFNMLVRHWSLLRRAIQLLRERCSKFSLLWRSSACIFFQRSRLRRNRINRLCAQQSQEWTFTGVLLAGWTFFPSRISK